MSFGYQQLHSTTYSVHYGLRANDDCCCCFPNIHFPQAIKLSSFHACTSSRWYSIAMYVLVSEMSGYGVPTYLPACKGLIILIHIACSTHILGILTTDESHLSMSVNRLSSHHFPLLNGQMVPEHYYTYLLIQPMPPSKISQ